MKFLRKAVEIVNFNRWKILYCISMCINILLSEHSGRPRRQKSIYPGTKSSKFQNNHETSLWIRMPKINQTLHPPWLLPSKHRFHTSPKTAKMTKSTSNVLKKQLHHHHEVRPISSFILRDALPLISTNEAVANTSSSLQLDKKPFDFEQSNNSLPKLTPPNTTASTLDTTRNEKLEKEVQYKPFEDSITLRVGAFFEGPEIEVLSAKFISALGKELSKLEDEFRASKLMKLDLNNDDSDTTIANIDDVLRELQFSSVFGNVNIEGLVMEPPSFEEEKVTKMCRTLMAKNVVVAIGLGTPTNIYAASILSQSAMIPLVTGTYTGYSDEEAFQDLFPYVVQTNPRLKDLWDSATSIIYSLNLYQPVLIHDASYQGLTLSHIAAQDVSHNTLQLSLDPNLPKLKFHSQLSSLLNTDRRVIFLCGTFRFISLTVEYGKTLGMFGGEFVWLLLDADVKNAPAEILIPGLLNIHPSLFGGRQASETFIRSSLSVILMSLKEGVKRSALNLVQPSHANCLVPSSNNSHNMSEEMNNFFTELQKNVYSKNVSDTFSQIFHIENLVPNKTVNGTRWLKVGTLIGQDLDVEALYWPGRGYKGVDSPTKRLRVAMVIAPPFVMTSQLIDNTTCLIGVICLKMFSIDVSATFKDWEDGQRIGTRFYKILCCNGLSVDLMLNLAKDLKLKLQVYIVKDGTFGAPRISGWTGIVGDILDGSAHLSMAPLSVTSQRVKVIDFSGPYFYSSMAVLSSTKKMETPLLAFLVPFSPELWVAIIISLNVTALAVAIYEWLSPFGLNPWGRKRSKNFSYGSALWVTWGLLFSHLVAFKAPKSWPNKVLINVWGAFSVIFVASYTANIAALFAGLFNMRSTHNKSFYAQKMGAVRQSSSEFYFALENPPLWAHIKTNLVEDYYQALDALLSGRLELLAGDAAFLDYMRANDPGCTLQSVGPEMVEDTFAIGMPKGFPLKRDINAALSQYEASGHLEYLRNKWYGASPCFRLTADIYKPQPLEIKTVAGVFLMLTLGIVIGMIILIIEHIVYRYVLPGLRTKPKDSIWRNRNLMFFSQKLYKFINCVELVSPHHSAKELVNNLKTGQIMGLFQKSVKRKENEQKRRRKSKAQFFEMIQEIRRVQLAERSLEGISSSAELLNTKDSEEADPPVMTSFISEASQSTNTTFLATYTTTTTSTTTSNLPLPIFPQSPSTTISSSVSSSTRRHSSIHLSAGIDKTDRKSPPGNTIDYIPGLNHKEDHEGILIINKCRQRDRRTSSGGESEILKKKRREKKRKNHKISKTCVKNESEDKCTSTYISPSIMVVRSGDSIKEREAKKMKKRRKLERSSRIENSIEGQSSNGNGRENNVEPSTGQESSIIILQVTNEPCIMDVLSLPMAVSAPASLFGDSSCLCHCHKTNKNTSALPSNLFFDSCMCESCSHNHIQLADSKSKSLDEAKIEPPSDFLSPIVSPSAKESTSISFPCSPHIFESSTAEQRPLLHFHSEGDNLWGKWESAESHPPHDIELELDPMFYGHSYEKTSPSGYQSSGSFHYRTSDSPNIISNDPIHLHNMTKGDLWKLWQNSEHELRHRLYQVQEERNLLASQLSKSYRHKSRHRRSKPKHFTYEGSSFESKEKNLNRTYELEVPIEFRDSASKDFRNKRRYSRSLEQGRAFKFDHSEPKSSSNHHNPFDKVSGIRDAYEDLYRSVKSLEDSLLETTELRLDSQRKSKSALPKSNTKRKDQRRCKSSLESCRRSRSLANRSFSESSDSLRNEKIFQEDKGLHGQFVADKRRDSSQDPRSTRLVQRKKRSSLSSLDPPEKFSTIKDFRRRRSKLGDGEKVIPFASLPRTKTQHKRKNLGYYSSSSDDENFYCGRRYTESSPVPLLQSLQRHSLGRQRKGIDSHSPKLSGSHKTGKVSLESFESPHQKQLSDRSLYLYDGISGHTSSSEYPGTQLSTKKFACDSKLFGNRTSFESIDPNSGDPF